MIATVPLPLIATLQRSEGLWWVVLATFPHNASERRLWCRKGVERPQGVRCIPYDTEEEAEEFIKYWSN